MKSLIFTNPNPLPISESEKKMMRRYETEPELKSLADQIHHDRLMCGDACLPCIAMAIKQMERP